MSIEESALSLFQRLLCKDQLRLHFAVEAIEREELLRQGDTAEIEAPAGLLPSLALHAILQFFHQYPFGRVIYLSIGQALALDLVQSQFELESVPLLGSERLESIGITSVVQLLAVLHRLQSLPVSQTVFVVMDRLSPLLMLHKATNVELFLQKLAQLNSSHRVFSIFLSTESSRYSGKLRNGLYFRDPIAVLWKNSLPRCISFKK